MRLDSLTMRKLAMLMMKTAATLMTLAHGAKLLPSHHLATQLTMPRNSHLLFSNVTISLKMKSPSRMKDLGDILAVDMEANTVVNTVPNMMALQDTVINHAKDVL